MKKREMAYSRLVDVFGGDAQMRAWAGAEVAQQAFDSGNCAERIVAQADSQGFGCDAAKGRAGQSVVRWAASR